MIGRKVNLSPFVVLVALSFWSAFWGVPGAILAVPLTSMLAIIFAAFEQTRPPGRAARKTMSANSNAGPCSRRVSPAVLWKTEARPRVTIFACALVLASVPIMFYFVLM